MSRIGLQPILIPSDVTIKVSEDNIVSVKGPKGDLIQPISRDLQIIQTENQLRIERPNNDRHLRAQHGLARTLINNMVIGVTQEHSKVLEIHGVGFRAQVSGTQLTLNIGYSHPVVIEALEGVKLEILADDKKLPKVKVSGPDKQKVGQTSAIIRKSRKPDPYKGKGVRYQGEQIKLKAGKKASAKK